MHKIAGLLACKDIGAVMFGLAHVQLSMLQANDSPNALIEGLLSVGESL